MKNFKTAFLLLTLMSVSFTSCLDSDSDYQPSYVAFVTISESIYGGTQLKSDFGNYSIQPTNTLASAGLEGAKRALINYYIPEGTEITESTTSIPGQLFPGQCSPIPISRISTRPDTCGTSKITKFRDFSTGYYSFPSMWAQSGYVNVSFQYSAASAAVIDMVQDSIKQDTLFLGLRVNIKNEGQSIGVPFVCFKLPEYYDLVNEGLLPKNDSIFVSVSAPVDNGSGSAKTEFVRWKTKANY